MAHIDEFPSDVYIDSWKAFRCESDEDDRVATYILDSQFWPSKSDIRILDVGCGDGRIINRLMSYCDLGSVVLVDPDQQLLADAKVLVTGKGKGAHVEAVNSVIGKDLLEEVGVDHDVIIIVHMLYLIKDKEEFLGFLDALPGGSRVFVVIDLEKSIFSTLWKVTAPKYYNRVVEYHEVINDLNSELYSVTFGEITSSIPNPLALSLVVSERVVSHMGYFNFADQEYHMRENVKDILRKSLRGDRIYCYSACYHIEKREC
ncbi:MAG: class I SAM-dependent methyltransferase [Candidatus Thiodiazotropha sp. (ex Troendleina suluensis)]|nr:class I SAM-dependent methyltransferase [Candidatus Thiodiazotropha sp. (ex Troendleina suluensis)]